VTLAYLDSSALVKLVIDEPGRDEVMTLWDAADAVVTSRLAHPEVVGAIATARRVGRLTNPRAREARRSWDRFRQGLRLVELSRIVEESAGDLVASHRLSGADAVHLASAIALADASVVMATFDVRLHAAARSASLRTLPARL